MAIDISSRTMENHNMNNKTHHLSSIKENFNSQQLQGSRVDKSKVLSNEEKQDKTVSDELLKAAIKHVNTKMEYVGTRCEYSYHEVTNRVSIKVIDKDTEEIIREIPPEETLEMIQKMLELAGILVDEKR